MPPHEHTPHASVGHGAEHLYPVVQLALLPHLFQQQSLRTVPSDDEMQIRIPLAHDLDAHMDGGMEGWRDGATTTDARNPAHREVYGRDVSREVHSVEYTPT